jgi:chemotaxis protein methyltransferase CheR
MSEAYPEALCGVDVIFYRNVSIYFDPATQRHIFDKLAGLLKEKGWLFVSATETLSHNHGTLQSVERKGIFCYQKNPELEMRDRRRQPSRETDSPVRRPAPATKHSAPSRPAPGVLPERRPLAAARRSPASPPPRPRVERPSFDEALALAKSKKYAQALTAVEGLLEKEPTLRQGQMLQAGLLINLNRLAEAEQVCLARLAVDRWCLESYLLLGLIAKLQGEHERAIHRFKEAIYIRSACWLAHFYLAEIHGARREEAPAAREYEIVIKLLQKGDLAEHGLTFFPLAFPAEQIMHLCRHNLAKLQRDQV